MKHITVLLLLTLICSPLQAEVYKWVDDQGKIHFSDKEPKSSSASKLELKINTYSSPTYSESSSREGNKKVVMYSTEWCGYCKKARLYFKNNNINYKEYDIERSAKANKEHKRLGATGVPLILVGKKKMNGFSETGFNRIYENP